MKESVGLDVEIKSTEMIDEVESMIREVKATYVKDMESYLKKWEILDSLFSKKINLLRILARYDLQGDL